MNPPQKLLMERGSRTGQPIVIAVDSTVLGPALGGCRVRPYASWSDGVADAVRLAAAMTEKAALAGLQHGGGKTVVALDPSTAGEFAGPRRAALLHDVGDLVGTLDGQYWTGPDIGTSPDDMAVIGQRTPFVFCRPERVGGSGDSSGPTAAGVLSCIEAVRRSVLGNRPLSLTSLSIVGLGHVGLLVARSVAEAGARLVVSDIDPSRRELAETLGAEWLDVDAALRAEVDLLVPAAVGGILTAATAAELRCRAIVGPANNQLDADRTADLIHGRGIVWAPDTVVSAGGVVAATAQEVRHLDAARTAPLLDRIGTRLEAMLLEAAQRNVSPLHVARRRAHERLQRAQPPM